jgi:hypothetical protein
MGALSSGAAELNVEHRDSPNWNRPDNTPRERYQTAMKEASAAQAMNLRDCNDKRGRERSNCVREAHDLYARDMKRARDEMAHGR